MSVGSEFPSWSLFQLIRSLLQRLRVVQQHERFRLADPRYSSVIRRILNETESNALPGYGDLAHRQRTSRWTDDRSPREESPSGSREAQARPARFFCRLACSC